MLKDSYKKMSIKQKEEYIANRILINLGGCIAGYIVLQILYMYASGRMGLITNYRYMMYVIFGVCVGLTIFFYIKSKQKRSYRNYGHLCLGLSIMAFFLNFPFYTLWLPIEEAPAAIQPILKTLKTIETEYRFAQVAIAVYAVIITAINCYHLYKVKSLKKLRKWLK